MKQVFFRGLIFFQLLACSALFAQKSNDEIILTIAGEEIKRGDFEAIYKKNNNSESIDPKTVEEYLDLYINFKLKVKEALDLKMDTFPRFRRELNGYRAQLAKPYLNDKSVTEDLIKEAYERMKEEIRASHILITCKPDASPEDTLKAFEEISKLREKAMKGKDFQALAAEHSKDPSARDNAGDLGYFSALYMVYPFENAAYNTKVGEISQPVRTRYGYHLIKVTDRRPSQGEITVAHIMVKTGPDATKEVIAAAKTKIEEIQQQINEGQDFGALARQFSDDKSSARKGGELSPFKAGRMIQEFEEAAFKLKEDGELSPPVQSAYGWHLIKRISKNDLQPMDKIYADIKDKVSRDTRSNKSRLSMLNKIKSEYGFKEYPKEKEAFYALIDSTYFAGEWNSDLANGYTKTMFKLGKTAFTQDEFTKFLLVKQRKIRPTKPKSIIDQMYEEWVGASCIDYEDDRLETKYPEFKLLVQEYHDGILLFDLTDQKVWSKAIKDTTGLKAYYEENKDNYKWGERLDAIVYSSASMEIAKATRSKLPKANDTSYTHDDLLKEMNTDSQLNLAVQKGKFEKGVNATIDGIAWKKGVTKIVSEGNRFTFVEVREVLPVQHKLLEEIKGLVTSDYQSHLEKEWIASLKEKYEVTIHEDVLKKMQ